MRRIHTLNASEVASARMRFFAQASGYTNV